MVTDLADFHHPVSNIFHSDLKKSLASFNLTNSQIEFFKSEGYLPGIQALNDQQVEQLRSELTPIMDPAHPGNSLYYEFHTNESKDPAKVLFHALGGWRITPTLHDILWAPGYLQPAFQLLGGPVRFWHDQLFCKPAKHGGVVAWHQDYSYWTRTGPMAHLTCWIALDDATVDNGCVHYIPKSHQWDLLPITGLAGDMESIRSVLSPKQFEQFVPTPVPLKKGQAVFHHPLTIHGSFENKTPNPRRAAVINVLLDGTISKSDEPLLTGVPAIAKGTAVKGKFFPLLHDGEKICASDYKGIRG